MPAIHHPSKHPTVTRHRVEAAAKGGILLTAAVLVASSGCTSPLTSVALREFLREATTALTPEPDTEDRLAAEASKPEGDEDPTEIGGETDAELAVEDGGADARDEPPIDVQIERSLERLARTRGLDPVARDVLVETLEKAETADWPAIIDSFAASLETSAPRTAADGAAPSPDDGNTAKTASRTVRKSIGGLTVPVSADFPADKTTPAVAPAVHETSLAASEPAPPKDAPAVAVEDGPSPSDSEAPEQATGDVALASENAETPEELVASLKQRLAEARRQAPLAVRRACFASKVRGWGNVDAFHDSRFVPGQNVLVYVELDNLVGVETPRGFATRVEASLQLVDEARQVVEEWTFPIVADTADSPRTDYFVRYLVRIPADAVAGTHRLNVVLTDTVSSKTVTTDLPLEVCGGGGG